MNCHPGARSANCGSASLAFYVKCAMERCNTLRHRIREGNDLKVLRRQVRIDKVILMLEPKPAIVGWIAHKHAARSTFLLQLLQSCVHEL